MDGSAGFEIGHNERDRLMTQGVQIDLVASEVISYAAAYNGAPVVLVSPCDPSTVAHAPTSRCR